MLRVKTWGKMSMRSKNQLKTKAIAMILLAFASVCLLPIQATAGPFGRLRNRGSSGGTSGFGGNGSQGGSQPVDGELNSAQGVANLCARLQTMRHWGNPTGGVEGVGCAMSAASALANTCKPHNGSPRDWGVAQGANGMFYACRRW